MQTNLPNFIITTDTMSDLPNAYLSEHGIETISLTYEIDGKVYDKTNSLPFKEFYDRMRAGSQPKSSQFNPEAAEKVFSQLIDAHDCDILHVSISTGLSGSFNSATHAAEAIAAKYPGRRVLVLDTLGASLGEGLLCSRAVDMRAQGMDIDQTFDALKALVPHACHLLTVDDIIYLYRGGRVSRTAAILGGVMNIKPLIHVDDEGRLIPIGKVRGRKRALMAVVDNMEQRLGSYKNKNEVIYITHGDAPEDAQFVADEIRRRFGFTKFVINFLGTTIGVHAGPGLIAVFFLGEHR